MKHFLFLLCFLFVSTSFGFTLNYGPNQVVNTGWQVDDLSFDIDTSCNPYLSIVQDSIGAAQDVWGNVPTSKLKISIGNTVTLPQPITTYVGNSPSSYAPVGNPIVYCDTSFGPNSGENANNIPGFAGAQNIQSDGKIVGGLLVLNFQPGAQANVSTLNSDLADVILTHEVGHILGIGHSADTNALMYYQTGAGRPLRLEKDDMDAITYLYPARELPPLGGLACGTLGRSRSSASHGIFEIFTLLLIALTAHQVTRRFFPVA